MEATPCVSSFLASMQERFLFIITTSFILITNVAAHDNDKSLGYNLVSGLPSLPFPEDERQSILVYKEI